MAGIAVRPRRWMRAPLAALAVVAVLPASAAAVAPTWDLSSHPSTSGRTQIFRGAVAPGADDVWAIGYSFGYVGGALEFRTLAQHWTGTTGWTTVPTPDVESAPAKDLIFDAAADGPNSIYASGISATAPGNQASKPLILHWDGSSWSIVALPAAPLGSSLSRITVKDGTVWAAGEKYNPWSGYWQPYIMRGQGGTWTEFPLLGTDLHPGPTGCKVADDGSLWRWEPGGLAIGRNGDVYVAGTCSTTGGDRALLAYRHGGRWRPAFDPATLPNETSRLNDVDADANGRVRAVGGVGTEPLILRGSAQNFVRETAPRIDRGTSLNSIEQGPPAYAVATVTGSDAWAHPGAYRFAGGQWRSEQVTTGFGNPFAVAVDPAGQAWGMGVSVTDDFGLILRRNAP